MVKKIKDVNKYIEGGNVEALIRSAENFHSNQYNDIINILVNDKTNTRLVCVAGPSSSGKTIFSNKLRQKLLEIGIESFVVSMDNYFCDKENIPLDEAGKYDFESIDVIEAELFNEQLSDLADGKDVYMTKYDFYTGKKVFDKEATKIDKCSLIFVEGIHALNYKVLFSHMDGDKIFGIYITPQDFYEAYNGERIEPHQVRLIRRIVRDTWHRNCNLICTLKMWDSVRAGEHKYIFPNKENADYNFNSSLKYELPVLRKFFMEEYDKLDDEEKEFCGKYLNEKLLEEFTPVNADAVPQASILNEFIP